MSDISPKVRAKLEKLAEFNDPMELIGFDNVYMSTFDAKTILDCLDTVAGLKGAMSMGKLSDQLVRVLMGLSTTETIDLTGRLPGRQEDDEPTIPLGDTKC